MYTIDGLDLLQNTSNLQVVNEKEKTNVNQVIKLHTCCDYINFQYYLTYFTQLHSNYHGA